MHHSCTTALDLGTSLPYPGTFCWGRTSHMGQRWYCRGLHQQGELEAKKHIKVLVLNVAKKNIRFYSLTLNKTTNTFSTLVAEIVDIIILVIFLPPRRAIQMYERFEQAPNKGREGLIWPISVDKTHSRNFVALKWQIHGLNKLQLSPYSVSAKTDVIKELKICK